MNDKANNQPDTPPAEPSGMSPRLEAAMAPSWVEGIRQQAQTDDGEYRGDPGRSPAADPASRQERPALTESAPRSPEDEYSYSRGPRSGTGSEGVIHKGPGP